MADCVGVFSPNASEHDFELLVEEEGANDVVRLFNLKILEYFVDGVSSQGTLHHIGPVKTVEAVGPHDTLLFS